MKKPIKEWGVVKFLTDKVPNAAGDIAETALGIATGENPVKAIADLLSGKDELSKEEIQKAQQLMADDLEREKMMYADRADAREMQKTALQQEDKFSKRFIYYYASAVTLMAFAIIFLLFFISIPDNNQRILDMSFGVVIGTGLVGIFQFFFGSSTGSKQKDGHIKALLERVKTNN